MLYGEKLHEQLALVMMLEGPLGRDSRVALKIQIVKSLLEMQKNDHNKKRWSRPLLRNGYSLRAFGKPF